MLRLLTGSAAIRILGAGSQLLLTFVVSRVCGASEAGIFFFGYSVLMILSVVSRLGCDLSGLREVAGCLARDDLQSVKVAGTSRLLLVTGTSLLLTMFLAASAQAVASHTFGEAGLPTLRLAAVGVLPFAVVGLLSELLKGAQRAWLALFLQNTAIPAMVIPIFLGLSRQFPPTATLASAVVTVCAWCVAVAAVFTWRSTYSHRLRQEPPVARKTLAPPIRVLLRESPALLTISLTPALMQWIGSSILGFFAGPASVAGYTVAMRISIAVSIVHSAAASVVSPQMAISHSAGDMRKLRRVSQQTGLLIMTITWPLLLVMLALAPIFMGVFGADFVGSAGALRILLVGQLVAALIGHSGIVLIMAGEYSYARYTSIAAGSILVLLSLATIPSHGEMAASVAMSCSVVAGHVLALLIVRKRLGFWTIPTSRHDVKELWSQRVEARS